MQKEKLIDEKTAVCRVEPGQLDQLLHPIFDSTPRPRPTGPAKGLPASPGAATGRSSSTPTSPSGPASWQGRDPLRRIETSPEDIGGMHVAKGILTSRGGMTSHAAVVARGMGKPCVAGCGDAVIDYKAKHPVRQRHGLQGGRRHHLNGTTGVVYAGKIGDDRPGRADRPVRPIMTLADAHRTSACAPTPTRPTTPRPCEFGAEGIGLCRTEHMFFERDRIRRMRQMILAEDEEGRRKALDHSCRCSRRISRASSRRWRVAPVTIRLLDPPLHEFVPQDSPGDRRAGQGDLGVSVAEDDQGQGRKPARVQPHARPPRLPAGHLPIPRSTRCRPRPSSRPPEVSGGKPTCKPRS